MTEYIILDARALRKLADKLGVVDVVTVVTHSPQQLSKILDAKAEAEAE